MDNQEHNFLPKAEQESVPVDPESMDFLNSKLQEAENRIPGSETKQVKFAEGGSHVARQEMEKMQKAAASDTSEKHPLTEQEKQNLMNKLLKPTEHAIFAENVDPYDAINDILDKAA